MTGWETALLLLVVALVAGAGVFLLVRHLKRKKEEKEKYDLVTKHGIKVMRSPMMSGLASAEIEEWTEDAMSFWVEKKGWSREKMLKAIAKVRVEMFDEKYIEHDGIKYNGTFWPTSFLMEITTKPKFEGKRTPIQRVWSLFRHELSHVIVGQVGGIKYDNDTHHALFREMGLGA